jgi:hypothetical protein
MKRADLIDCSGKRAREVVASAGRGFRRRALRVLSDPRWLEDQALARSSPNR